MEEYTGHLHGPENIKGIKGKEKQQSKDNCSTEK